MPKSLSDIRVVWGRPRSEVYILAATISSQDDPRRCRMWLYNLFYNIGIWDFSEFQMLMPVWSFCMYMRFYVFIRFIFRAFDWRPCPRKRSKQYAPKFGYNKQGFLAIIHGSLWLLMACWPKWLVAPRKCDRFSPHFCAIWIWRSCNVYAWEITHLMW